MATMNETRHTHTHTEKNIIFYCHFYQYSCCVQIAVSHIVVRIIWAQENIKRITSIRRQKLVRVRLFTPNNPLFKMFELSVFFTLLVGKLILEFRSQAMLNLESCWVNTLQTASYTNNSKLFTLEQFMLNKPWVKFENQLL